MKQIIETDRLILKEFIEDDAQALFLLNADSEVIRYTGDGPFVSIADALEFIHQYNEYKNHGYGRWAVIDKTTNVFLDWCGLKYHLEGYTDLGFRFHKRYRNKGYATESGNACLSYAVNNLNLKEIVGRVASENFASIKVLQKLGMVFWKNAPCDGIEDSLYYKFISPPKSTVRASAQ